MVYPWVALFWLIMYPRTSLKRLFKGGRTHPIKLNEEEEERMNDPSIGSYRTIEVGKNKSFRILEHGDLDSGLKIDHFVEVCLF